MMVALSALSSGLFGQPVVFQKTPRETLESRLRDCPEKNEKRYDKPKELFKKAGGPEDRLFDTQME